MDRYARRYGYDDPDAFRVLLAMIRAMDNEFLAEANRRAQSKEAGHG